MKQHNKTISWGILALAIILLITGCNSLTRQSVRNSPPQAQDALATVGDRIITLSEFQEKLDNIPPKYRENVTTKEQKERFLERLVQIALFSIEARTQNIDKEERVQSRIKDAVDSILWREYVKREIKDKITVTDEEVKEYYDTHLDEFKHPEKVKAGHILIKVARNASPEDWAEAENKAKDLKAQLDSGADFASLAKENSDDPATKEKGGKLGYFTRGKISPEFSDVAFSLRAGAEISEPVKTRHGYHIIKVEAKMPEQIKELAKVRVRIKSKLRSKKQRTILEQITKRLKEKYKVMLNTELLSYDEGDRPSPSLRRG